ncbi:MULTISPECIES: hypothetical protein [unclassified Pseudomonas]|uniref:hypothetical protein n=1 Tax=unclassified Pseudomonas TaxID=196821 RepID=UPI0030D8CAB5
MFGETTIWLEKTRLELTFSRDPQWCACADRVSAMPLNGDGGTGRQPAKAADSRDGNHVAARSSRPANALGLLIAFHA